jgi:hypothetical protein
VTLRFGYTRQEWEQARDEIRPILIQRVSTVSDPDISYSELCDQISTIHLEPHSYALSHLLGEISEAEHREQKPLISVLVVLQDERQPGAGFFDMARHQDYDVGDRLGFWMRQRNLTISSWSNPGAAEDR